MGLWWGPESDSELTSILMLWCSAGLCDYSLMIPLRKVHRWSSRNWHFQIPHSHSTNNESIWGIPRGFSNSFSSPIIIFFWPISARVTTNKWESGEGISVRPRTNVLLLNTFPCFEPFPLLGPQGYKTRRCLHQIMQTSDIICYNTANVYKTS